MPVKALLLSPQSNIVLMVDPYEALLKKAYTNITETSGDSERFTVPEAKIYIEGKTTVLENFSDIASILRREQDHLMKYLLGELGTAGKIDGPRAVFNGKFEWEHLNNAIKNYTVDYVICSECGKPDTRLVKDGRIPMLRCDACGGHRPVRKRRARTEPVGTQLEEGAEVTVEIHHLSKRGDGVAKVGKYTLYVAGTKPNQKVKVRITRIAGSIAFTEKV
jgi:translation initiation factor 2 subunit 2